MLVDPDFRMVSDEVAVIFRELTGSEWLAPQKLTSGVYELDHFNGETELDRQKGWGADYDHSYPRLTRSDGNWFGSYGVCDDFRQVLDQCSMLATSEREFVVFVTEVRREDQSEDGGWRWHKWGSYIGTREPTCEYLYDEPEIDAVYVYHITERKRG